VGHVICRPTQQEADEYYQHAITENADWGAVERMMARAISSGIPTRRTNTRPSATISPPMRGYPFVGTTDKVADELANLKRAGVRGIAFSLVNYVDELPYVCEEVLPRLARLGLRQSP
jgi:alkanesulfonate monooxygenase SsuD/methylene tetrahydromethanopterin reductase-like flavin-dependent oxidoreductase (luciferase family)